MIVAIPLLIQLGRSIQYRRYIDSDGEPVNSTVLALRALHGDESAVTEIESLNEEIALFRGKDCEALRGKDGEPPEEEGWQRVEAFERDFRKYINVAFGALLILAAVSLLFGPLWPTQMVAWGVFVGTAFFWFIRHYRGMRL